MSPFRNRVLLAADLSNLLYACTFSAKNRWEKTYPEESSFLSPLQETDQENLPDLLNLQSFRRVLSSTVQDKFESVLGIARKWHQTEIDSAEGLDVFLAEDDRLSGNFRKRLYPEYKQQRKTKPSQFDVYKVMDYIRGVILSDLGIRDRMGWHVVKVPDCESDDVIAVLMSMAKDYMCRILVSSDRDYLQLEGVSQYDVWGEPVRPQIKAGTSVYELSVRDFLLWKIVRGDPSDNIKGVFPKYGDVKSYRLVQDKGRLRKMLKESNSAASRYSLNRKLIDFGKIPGDVRSRIESVLEREMEGIRSASGNARFDDFIRIGE